MSAFNIVSCKYHVRDSTKIHMTHLNEFFTIEMLPSIDKTQLVMRITGPTINTHGIPATKKILKSSLPSILRSKCFNENNFSFSREVKNTEIGHLFEHILLEYLCALKISAGHKDSVHNGLTSWNWKKDARGTFHITIDAGVKDREFLLLALEQAVNLTVKIMQSNFVYPTLPSYYLPAIQAESPEFT